MGSSPIDLVLEEPLSFEDMPTEDSSPVASPCQSPETKTDQSLDQKASGFRPPPRQQIQLPYSVDECSTTSSSCGQDELDSLRAASRVPGLGGDLAPVATRPLTAAEAQDASARSRSVSAFSISRPLTLAETSIVFDFDDTLLPTSFITDAVRMFAKCASPGLLQRSASSRRSSGRSLGRQRSFHASLPPDFPCYSALQRHAGLVEQILRAAKASADRVCIVTLAERPWVFESSDLYLPGLDMAGLLKELQIPVYYAPEHKHKELRKSGLHRLLPQDGGEDHEDSNVNLKRNAMMEFLQLKNGAGSVSQGEGIINVLSIGDSPVEQEATQEVVAIATALRDQPGVCKTVKLMADPSLKQLSDELEALLQHLPALASFSEAVELVAETPEDLRVQLTRRASEAPVKVPENLS